MGYASQFVRAGAKRRRIARPKRSMALANKLAQLPNPPKKDLSFPQGGQTFRFLATAALAEYGITRANLLSMLIVGSGTNSAHRLIQCLKLTRVEAWSPPEINATATLGIEWIGSTTGLRCIDDANVANTASYICTSPPKGSSDSAFWIQTAVNESTVAFAITCPAGTVVDIHCAMTTVSSYNIAMPGTSTSTGNTANILYFNSLDQTVNHLVPVGALNTIF